MRRFSFAALLVLFVFSASAQTGYEIKVTFKPFKNQYVYLGHYSGKQMPIDDSVLLNANSEGVFKGNKALGGGIYFIGYPTKDRFFEFLVDKQQHFSIAADTLNINQKKFTGSPDNTLFLQYQQQMKTKGEAIQDLRQQLAKAGTKADSATITTKINTIDDEISKYRNTIVKNNPGNILSVMLRLMQEPTVPKAAEHPGGRYDSLYAYRYFKDHYWDDLNFWDDRLSRTPAQLFDERVDKYFKTLVYHQPDSVNKEIDRMLDFASVSDEMTKFLLVKFINRYLRQQYMWEDAVFVHLYEKYFSNKDYSWLTPQGKKTITDRAYSLMANIMGNPAENIILPDSTGKMKNLYELPSKFTIVAFWDPLCGHCKEVIPHLDSMYKAKWKKDSVQIYAVAKEIDGTPKDWKDFISKNDLRGWTNVFYSKKEEKSRIDANVPGYSQLYDVQSFPTLYLLDKDKRIIAKKLTWQQIDDVLDWRKKGNNQ